VKSHADRRLWIGASRIVPISQELSDFGLKCRKTGMIPEINLWVGWNPSTRISNRIDWSVQIAAENLQGDAMEPQSTRDHLLQVGLRRIHAMGYSATGVNEILEEAKVPKGSFYHHFASKEDFAKEVLSLYVRGEGERAEKVLSGGKGSPLKRLRRYFEELIKVYGPQATISGCMVGNLTLEMADHSEAIQSLLHQSFSTWQGAIAAILQEAIDGGELARSSKPQELASFLLNSYEGALLRSKADRSGKPLEIFLHLSFNVLLKA
jgi:TetR/AcrR family transcriptional regulator, transcriptional repressor for nem operon